jgi:hypothetical protein
MEHLNFRIFECAGPAGDTEAVAMTLFYTFAQSKI